MNEQDPISDSEIIEKILKGDFDCYEELVDKYRNYVFSIVKDHVSYDMAAEVCHEIFVEIYRCLESCRKRESFRFWIRKIAVRKCYAFLRDKYKHQSRFAEGSGEETEEWLKTRMDRLSVQDSLDKEKQEELRELLEVVMTKLSAKERMVMNLIYLEDLSTKETAELLGWSVVNVKVQAFRIRRKLKEMLSIIPEGERDVL